MGGRGHIIFGDKSIAIYCKVLAFFFRNPLLSSSVAEPHHFYAAPAPGENFDAAPATPALAAPAPTLLYSKAKFLKRTKVYTHVETILFI
jgi:hypothetical protein